MEERKVPAIAACLAAYAVLGPVTLTALAAPAGPAFGATVLAASLAGPALVAIHAARRGLGALAAELRLRPDDEPRQALLRLGLSAALLAYVVAGTASGWTDAQRAHLTSVAAAAGLAAWLVLLHAMLRPRSRTRRILAPIGDAVFLGLFLHWGEAGAAPCAALYLALVCDQGLRFGPRSLAASALVGILCFAAVVATTPFWRTMPVADAAALAALAVVTGYGAALTRRSGAATSALDALKAERAQNSAFLHHELTLPLDAIIAAGDILAARATEPGERDAAADVQTAARTLSGLLEAHLASSEPSAEESFVLRDLLANAMALLRARAADKGVALALTVDPRLPYRCRGSALRLTEAVMNLLAAAVAEADDGTIALTAALVEGTDADVIMRIEVTHPGGRGLGGAFARAVATAIARALDGTLAFSEGGESLELRLPISDEGADSPPNLEGAYVLIQTPDRVLADRLVGLVAAANGKPVRSADAEPAPDAGAIVVIDARREALAALAMAHRLAALTPRPALILIADQTASAAIARVAAAELASVLEEPVTDAAFAGALASAHPLHPRAAAAGMTLLVVIEEGGRERLKLALERAGHRVVLATDGGSALAAIDRGGLDAVILDLAGESMGGEAVAKLCRLRHPGGTLPLVALAGDAAPKTEARCFEAGFDAVAVRGGGAAAILAAIERARTAARRGGSILAPDVAHIAAHPRFLGDGAEVVREAILDALRGLGGADFVADVVESFRHEAARLTGHLHDAAARADAAQFTAAVHAMHSAAANVGGIRLAQTLAALEDVGQSELRHAGTAFVEKIETELARLSRTLEPFARKERHA